MNKKHEYCGKCMFCVSVCPECGSSDVDVSGLISFSYSNHLQDDIDIGGVPQEFVTQGEISQSTDTPVPFSKSPLACPPF